MIRIIKLRQWLHKYLPELHTSTRLRQAIPHPPVVGERNSRTIRNILMPSTLPSPTVNQSNPGCFPCNKNRCIICAQHLIQTTTFTSTQSTATFHIKHNMTCETSNIVYLLFCNKCPKSLYVGETKNTLKQRFYLHRSNIKKNTGTLVTKHFNQTNHSLANLKCIAIEKQHSHTHTLRLHREAYGSKPLTPCTHTA